MISSRLFLCVGALSSKAFAFLFAGSSAIIAAIFGEFTTNSALNAALAGTALSAVCLMIPRVMEQRRKARESAAKLSADSIALMMDVHKRELNFYQSKIAALELAITLHVKSKHKIVGEWTAATQAYQVLRGQVRSLGKTPEIELHTKSYHELVGESDEKLETLSASRVADCPFLPHEPV